MKKKEKKNENITTQKKITNFKSRSSNFLRLFFCLYFVVSRFFSFLISIYTYTCWFFPCAIYIYIIK